MTKHASAMFVLSLCSCASAYAAEEALEFKLVVVPIEVRMLDAPDMPGQQIMSMKAKGAAYFKDGRVASKDFIYNGDFMKGAGAFFGYSTYTFEDGSSLIARFEGKNITGQPQHGDYTILSGTGKYVGVKGTGTFDAVSTKWQGTSLFDGSFRLTTR